MNYRITTILILLLPGLAAAQQTREFSVGEAFDLKSGELLYREQHCRSIDDLDREVIYRQGDGLLLAYKTIDYRSGKATPSFLQHNLQQKTQVSVQLEGKNITLSALQKDVAEAAKIYTTEVLEDLPLVIDAGFDSYIRDNWESLISGKLQRFRFPVPARASLVTLRIKPETCSFDASDEKCFSLEMSNWLLRMLVAPIELAYHDKQHYLSRYRGLANIENAAGEGMVVDIHYSYPPQPGKICESPLLE